MKKEIVVLRKQIFNNLKDRAQSYEASISRELIQYKKDQTLLSNRNFFQSHIDELIDNIKKSRVTYLGDFHTFDQNIRNVIRILRVLLDDKRDCVIALEMVDAQFQFYIDSYLEGHITDLEFLESIEYHESWRFPWSHYKLIFELAKENKIQIVALNSEGTLPQRDHFASNIIVELLKNHTQKQILVLYGELHIVKDKIPAIVESKISGFKKTIIHQNLDEVYWKQIEKNNSHEVIKFDAEEFCINSAPPWIKYESMIYWYENLCDDPDFDIHEYIIETGGKKIFSDDTRDNFLQMCIQLIKTAGLSITDTDIADFNLYDHTSLDFIIESTLDLNDESLSELYQHYISESLSFKLPHKNAYYCSSYSVNRLAYLCGMHIHQFYCGKHKIIQEELLTKSSCEAFSMLTLHYMSAYFFSKIINPHRKCPLYKDFVLFQTKDKNFFLAKEIIDSSALPQEIQNLELAQISDTATLVGHLLGEYLYRSSIQEDNQLSIHLFLNQTQFDDFSFQKMKKSILSEFNYKNHYKRYF